MLHLLSAASLNLVPIQNDDTITLKLSTFVKCFLSLSSYHRSVTWLFFIYLSSLLVAHLSDAPRRRLVVKGDNARIQDETTENSAWFFTVLGV